MKSMDAWISFVLMLAMCVIACWPKAREALNHTPPFARVGSFSRRFVTRFYWLLFVLAFLAAIAVRIYRFPELPAGLNQDGAMGAVDAWSLLKNGTDQYGSSWPVHFEAWRYGQMSVLYSYWSIPFLAVLGLSKFSLRLPMLVISLMALPVLWDFARRLLGKNYALLLLWFVAISPWQIMQSRWALDCNMMPHMVLFSLYFLYLGIRKKPFLWISMGFFGLTMYTYGTMLYTLPILLVACALYLLRMRRIKLWEALLCAGIFVAIAFPFLLTMAINTFGWETIKLGPFSMQRFYESERSNDILLFSPTPYAQLQTNLYYLSVHTFLQGSGEIYSAVARSRVLYTFTLPLILGGIGLLWWRRRQLRFSSPANASGTSLDLDGASLVFFWLGAMIACGLLTNESNINRATGIFYPLTFCLCYALYGLLRRIPAFLPVLVALYIVAFGFFCQGYFLDEDYIQEVGVTFNAGLHESLERIHAINCDTYYITLGGATPKVVEMETMVAHSIDAGQKYDVREVIDAEGYDSGYYTYKYVYTDFAGFEPDPMEDAAYVVFGSEVELFDPQEYLIWPFGRYAAVYPRDYGEE